MYLYWDYDSCGFLMIIFSGTSPVRLRP